MYIYELPQWLLFFFFYCFCGWVWECCYVSARTRKWVNRGFLRGPFLPIYGSGAIIILFLTLPVKDTYPLVFLFGTIGASILEYFTGTAMEKLFGMRYWDYSDDRFNLNGQICLRASFAWGCFSVLLVEWVHKPIECMILAIPDTVAGVAAFVLTVIVVIDITQSVNAALDLKEMLQKATENSTQLRRLEKRVDVVVAFLDEDRKQRHKKSAEKRKELEMRIQEYWQQLLDGKNRKDRRLVQLLKGNPGAMSKEFAEALSQAKQVILHRRSSRK